MHLNLSVITICYNNLAELISTCQSVDKQTIKPEEHLIINGSSNKEIEDWFEKNPQPSYRKTFHEPDNGISDAFNKGIEKSKGEITHLLNSGDRYADDKAIETVLAVFKQDPELGWVHGKYIQHRGNMDVISGVPFDAQQLWKGMRTVAHPTMFIKKAVYLKHGLYNLTYKIAMDYDLLVRIRHEKNRFIDRPLVYFAPGGASNVHFRKGLEEVKRSHRAHIGNDYRQVIWQWRQRMLHLFMGTTVGERWFRSKNRSKQVQ